MDNQHPFSLARLSRSLVRIPSNIIRISRITRSSPIPRSSRESPTIVDCPTTAIGHNGMHHNAKPLLNPNEISLITRTLNRALKELDFGNEIVIRLLNDKRSLFKSLLARCAAQAHEIEVFDVQSLARFCPRAVQVGDGVTRFFERVVIALEQCETYAKLEETLSEMCRANGQLHYRMKLWTQSDGKLKSEGRETKLVRSTGDLSGFSPRFIKKQSLIRLDTIGRSERRECIEVVWMKLMQAVITWMKQGFLEAAMSGKEEQDEEL